MNKMSVLERSANQCLLMFRNDPKVIRYRVSAADTLDKAHLYAGVSGTGADNILEVDRGRYLRSLALRRRRLGMASSVTRGQTHAVFDFDEFKGASYVNVPRDSQFSYLIVEEYFLTTDAYAAPSPIYIVPNAGFYNMMTPAFTIGGTSPTVATTANGILPLAGSMEIVMPRFLGSFVLRNLDDTDSLYFSFGNNMPMVEVPASAEVNLTNTQSDNLIIAAPTGTPAFNVVGGAENAAI